MTYRAEREAKLAELLKDLTQEGRCQFDHEGYCQEHDWFTSARPCPHGRAQQALEAYQLTGVLL